MPYDMHRAFVLAVGVLFGALNIFNACELIFGDYYVGEILFQYSEEHVFYRRSVQRSIFIQIFMFSFRGLKIMVKDKKMELLMFVHGNIYRKTGTIKYVEQESFVKRIRHENVGETITHNISYEYIGILKKKNKEILKKLKLKKGGGLFKLSYSYVFCICRMQ